MRKQTTYMPFPLRIIFQRSTFKQLDIKMSFAISSVSFSSRFKKAWEANEKLLERS